MEDWLNPEPEVGGEFAPQVQHYLAGQAGPPDCACRPLSGLSAQQKISKVSLQSNILGFLWLKYFSPQTVDEQYLRSGGPTRASPRSPAGPSASTTATGAGGPSGNPSPPTQPPSRAGKRKSRDTDNKANLVREKNYFVALSSSIMKISPLQAVKESTKTTRCKRPKVANTN